jgi:hypothetical protein
VNYLRGLALNHNPSNLSLLISWTTGISHQHLAMPFLLKTSTGIFLIIKKPFHLHNSISSPFILTSFLSAKNTNREIRHTIPLLVLVDIYVTYRNNNGTEQSYENIRLSLLKLHSWLP